MLQTITFNINNAQVRHETMEGRDYVVAPMVMLTEGVHAGSNGPLYYPESELAKTPAVWNHKPIVVYHPQLNGQPISACEKIVIENRKVGVIMNATFDGKLRAEAWVEVDKALEVDDRVIECLATGTLMEVSTGLFTDNESTTGTWNEEDYEYIARNYRPDHLALLPDQKGACSIADGAGLFQTNQSHDALRENLREALNERFGTHVWVADVYDDFVVYEIGNRLWQLAYISDAHDVVLDEGIPVRVKRVIQYRTLAGDFVGNSSMDFLKTRENGTMTKAERVAGLIDNKATRFGEDDREFLEGLDECQLEKLEPVANEDGGGDSSVPGGGLPDPSESAAAAAAGAAGVSGDTDDDEPTGNSQPTIDEIVANAGGEVGDMLREGLAARQGQRDALIGTITGNSANAFTADELAEMPLSQLQKMAAMAAPAGSESPAGQIPTPSFAGAAGPAPAANAGHTEEPMVAPTMNFAK